MSTPALRCRAHRDLVPPCRLHHDVRRPAAAVAGIVLLFLKRWALAHVVAKEGHADCVLVLGLAVAELQVVWSAPDLIAPLLMRTLPPGDPGERARALAEAIS